MTALEELDIRENKNFMEIPTSFCDLTNLKVFLMQNTSLETLPYELQYWTGLVELNMRENTQIEQLPGKIFPFIFYSE